LKGKLRPVDYLTWAATVPTGARWDLSASGVPDGCGPSSLLMRGVEVGGPGVEGPGWPLGASLELGDLCRRDRQAEITATFMAKVGARYGLAPGCVTPTLGASGAIAQVLAALARPGDHVIVERPTFEPLQRVPEMLGLRVSRLERKFEEQWEPLPDRLARLLTPKTRAVILSSLHNPSGMAISTSTLEAIGEMAARVGALVLVDEVYLDFAFDPAGEAHAWRPACLTIDNGVSWSSTTKAFGFSTLRAGWVVARDPELAAAFRNASAYFHVSPPLGSLALASEVLDHAAILVDRANAAISEARAVLEDWLEREPRVSWVPPSAGQTCLLKLPSLTDDLEFTRHLRERYGTQVVPGTLFEAPGFVRVSFNLPVAELEPALASITSTLDDFELDRAVS